MSRSSATSWILRASVALAAFLWCAAALAQSVTQFDAQASDGIALGPDGAMWFTEFQFSRIGRIDPNGVLSLFPLPPALFPAGIAVGADGNLWFTENDGPHRIGRITTAGTLTEFDPPTRSSRPFGITSGPDGKLWFTETQANQIGRLTTAGVFTEFPVPTASAGLSGITAGPDGNLWFTESTGNKIARITTTGVVSEFALPTANSHPTGIAAGPDGNIWFAESLVPRVGRITPTGDITEFPVSSGSQGVVAGNDGNLWFSGSGVLRRVTPSGVVTEFPVPLYGPSPLGIAVAPDGALWITDNVNGFGGQIVRFAFETVPCVADATTLCLDNGRFRVTASWRKSDGSTGQGSGVALTADSGYFWFFNAANVEVVVKVLNGCSANGSYWVFGAGLTNVEVALRVTDTFSGVARTYTNPLGTPFAPIQDTSAFATCP